MQIKTKNVKKNFEKKTVNRTPGGGHVPQANLQEAVQPLQHGPGVLQQPRRDEAVVEELRGRGGKRQEGGVGRLDVGRESDRPDAVDPGWLLSHAGRWLPAPYWL